MINDFANKYRRKLLLVTTLKYLTANVFVSFLCFEILHNISRVGSVEDTNKSVTKFFQQLNNDEFLGKLLETFLIVSNIFKYRNSQNNGFMLIASFLDFIFVCNCVSQIFVFRIHFHLFSFVYIVTPCSLYLWTKSFRNFYVQIYVYGKKIARFWFSSFLSLYCRTVLNFIRLLSLVFNFFSSPLPLFKAVCRS